MSSISSKLSANQVVLYEASRQNLQTVLAEVFGVDVALMDGDLSDSTVDELMRIHDVHIAQRGDGKWLAAVGDCAENMRSMAIADDRVLAVLRSLAFELVLSQEVSPPQHITINLTQAQREVLDFLAEHGVPDAEYVPLTSELRVMGRPSCPLVELTDLMEIRSGGGGRNGQYAYSQVRPERFSRKDLSEFIFNGGPYDDLTPFQSELSQYVSVDKAADVLREIRNLMEQADRAWASLPGAAANCLNEQHQAEASLGMCVRMGLQAAEELLQRVDGGNALSASECNDVSFGAPSL